MLKKNNTKSSQIFIKNQFSKKLLFLTLSIIALSFLTIKAAYTTNKPDYENYIISIQAVRATSEFSEKIFFAKDVLFLIIVELSSLLGNDEIYVFLVVALITLISKIIYIISDINKPLLYTFLYVLLLYPALDFAAIRAGMGLSLLGLSLSYKSNGKALFTYALSTTSHISMATAITPILLRLQKIIYQRLFISIFTITALSYIGSHYFQLLERSSDYEYNQSTMFGFIPSAIAIIISISLRYLIKISEHSAFSLNCLIAGIFSTALGFGLVGRSVTTATRLNEIALYLFLICICSIKLKYNWRLFTALGMIAILPIYRSISLNLWDPFFSWF